MEGNAGDGGGGDRGQHTVVKLKPSGHATIHGESRRRRPRLGADIPYTLQEGVFVGERAP